MTSVSSPEGVLMLFLRRRTKENAISKEKFMPTEVISLLWEIEVAVANGRVIFWTGTSQSVVSAYGSLTILS